MIRKLPKNWSLDDQAEFFHTVNSLEHSKLKEWITFVVQSIENKTTHLIS